MDYMTEEAGDFHFDDNRDDRREIVKFRDGVRDALNGNRKKPEQSVAYYRGFRAQREQMALQAL